VPLPVAKAAASALELAWTALGRQDEPPLTRFLVSQMSTAHWFDISAAKRDLGYRPSVSIEEGMRRLKDWLAGAKAPAAA
jgi:nucleoside-diphosphate-sugar epimerase